MKMSNLNDLLAHELKDLHDAESQLISVLPKLAEAASDSTLVKAFKRHVEETRRHVDRLEKALEELETAAEGGTCEAMQRLLKEGESLLDADVPSKVMDAALIVSVQKVEHYEIASYGGARSLAHQLGMDTVADLLAETLAEETAANDRLTRIALDSVNPEAASV